MKLKKAVIFLCTTVVLAAGLVQSGLLNRYIGEYIQEEFKKNTGNTLVMEGFSLKWGHVIFSRAVISRNEQIAEIKAADIRFLVSEALNNRFVSSACYIDSVDAVYDPKHWEIAYIPSFPDFSVFPAAYAAVSPVAEILQKVSVENGKIGKIRIKIRHSGFEGMVIGSLAIENNNADGTFECSSFPLQDIVKIAGLDSRMRAENTADITVNVKGTLPLKLHALISAADNTISVFSENSEIAIPVKKSRANINFDTGTMAAFVADSEFSIFNGKILPVFDVKLSDSIQYSGNAAIKNIDAARFFAANPGLGNCPAGRINGSVKNINGIAGIPDSVNALCDITAEKSIFQGFPILQTIASGLQMFFKLDLMQIVLSQDMHLQCVVKNGKISGAELLNQILHNNPNVIFEGDAQVGLDTSLSGTLQLKVKKEYLRDGFHLEAEDAEYIALPVGLSGNLFEPEVNIDDIRKKIMKDAVKNVVPGLLKGLFK